MIDTKKKPMVLTPAQCLLIQQAAQTMQALHESLESPEEEALEHKLGHEMYEDAEDDDVEDVKKPKK